MSPRRQTQTVETPDQIPASTLTTNAPAPMIAILKADARHLPLYAESMDCCVTSPPYWGLRKYDCGDAQFGLEATPQEYVDGMVAVFREVRLVLKPAGTLWLVIGDSYSTQAGQGFNPGGGGQGNRWKRQNGDFWQPNRKSIAGLKPKDLVGIPWRVAFALQADGWWLRSDIVWAKSNPMPESVRDRPTKAHEYVFLLAKSERYYYDATAIAEPIVYGDHPRNGVPGPDIQAPGQPVQSGITKRRRSGNKERVLGPGRARPGSHLGASIPWEDRNGKRNRRSVWTIATQPYRGAHFATFPEELARVCIRAGCPPGGIVLDPFGGSGTVAKVAYEEGRTAVSVDLAYHELAKDRTSGLQASLCYDVTEWEDPMGPQPAGKR